jgi:hypothetical protein
MPPGLLRLGNHLQGNGRFAGRFRAKDSTTRPRGTPPTPSAASNEIAPVEITAIGTMASFDPSRMMDPLPNCFSIC